MSAQTNGHATLLERAKYDEETHYFWLPTKNEADRTPFYICLKHGQITPIAADGQRCWARDRSINEHSNEGDCNFLAGEYLKPEAYPWYCTNCSATRASTDALQYNKAGNKKCQKCEQAIGTGLKSIATYHLICIRNVNGKACRHITPVEKDVCCNPRCSRAFPHKEGTPEAQRTKYDDDQILLLQYTDPVASSHWVCTFGHRNSPHQNTVNPNRCANGGGARGCNAPRGDAGPDSGRFTKNNTLYENKLWGFHVLPPGCSAATSRGDPVHKDPE